MLVDPVDVTKKARFKNAQERPNDGRTDLNTAQSQSDPNISSLGLI